jgi:uncharacterized protein (DUF488 family)
MKLFTIGFTKKSAEQFFTRIKSAGVKRVLDIRLHRDSQLAGFAKERDLRFFLKTICDIDYHVVPELAPTQELLDAYKKQGGKWEVYESEFQRLLAQRKPESSLNRSLVDGACLLCSEAEPKQCHRRLVAEHLDRAWGGIEVRHL